MFLGFILQIGHMTNVTMPTVISIPQGVSLVQFLIDSFIIYVLVGKMKIGRGKYLLAGGSPH